MATRYKAPIGVSHTISDWLTDLKLSQQDLADRMETDKSNVTRWIAEPWRVNLDVLAGVSEALKDIEPLLADHGNLLRTPAEVRAYAEMRRAAEMITGRPEPDRPRR